MSELCTIDKCSRKSRGLCDCCQQNLCLQHLSEHNISLLTQLNPLTDEINALSDRLNILNIDQIIGQGRRKLEQWRNDCHKQIDAIYKKKCQELHQSVSETIEQQRNAVHEIQRKITELINLQETTRRDIDLLTSTIRQIQKTLNNVEKRCIRIQTRPLLVDETFVILEPSNEHELDISTISTSYKTIQRPERSSRNIACNNRHLLLHQHPNLCLLDHEMNIVKEARWFYGIIQDMCWSSKLNRFILLEGQNIFLLDENTMTMGNIEVIDNHEWLSCTCSDTVLYVGTKKWGSSIIEFSLVPTIEMIKEWKTPVTCGNEELIAGSIYNDGKLALMVVDMWSKSVRMELRFVTTFEQIWSLELGVRCADYKGASLAVRCCSLHGDEWLIMAYESDHLLQITDDGKLKKRIEYHSRPCRATLLDENKLAILTEESVNLHKIE